jgi:glutathione S-transferase
MTVARKLISSNVSPWSERAKWALDHHGLAYEVVEHVPIVGERRLRRIVGSNKPRATVPVLIAGADVLTESWDIAVYADREGNEAKLIPSDHESTIRSWVAVADEAANACRALVLAGIFASKPALDEQAPPFVPKWMRPALRPVARAATRAFMRKYGIRFDAAAEQRQVLRSALDRLRAALAAKSPYLLGSFTYADIAMAGLLQGISPVDDRFMKIGPASRAVWTQPTFATEYADVIAWRDSLYESRRRSGRGRRTLS